MTIQEFVLTVTEFEQFITQPENKDQRFELIYGTVVKKMAPTQEHGFVASNISAEIRAHVKPRNLGKVSVETSHKAQDDEYNYRIPDVSFVQGEGLVKRGAMPHMPAIAIEIKSPDDTYTEMREKANYYLSNGAQLVWLIFPEKQRVEVHAHEQAVITLEADDTLTGGDVLPDFALVVSEIFE